MHSTIQALHESIFFTFLFHFWPLKNIFDDQLVKNVEKQTQFSYDAFDLKNSSFLQNIFIRIARFIEGNNSLIIVTKNFHIMFD